MLRVKRDENKLVNNSYLEKGLGDHIYYNIVLGNNGTTSIQAAFSETRTDSILEVPSDYRMAIVAFSVPTTDVPIMSFLTQGPFTVTLTYLTFVSKQTVTYFVPNSTYGPPYQQLIFTYEELLKQINIALGLAFDALNVMSGHTLPSTAPPFILFNPATQIFSLIVPQVGYNTFTETSPENANTFNTNRITIYMNTILANLFDGLTFIFHSEGSVNGTDTEFVVQQESNPMTLGFNGSSAATTIPPPSFYSTYGAYPTYYVMNMQYPATVQWYQPSHLQFLSNEFGVRNEYIPGSQNNSISLLTDFQFPLSDQISQQRPFIQFFVQGQYKYIDILKDTPLKRTDMTLFWTDDQQNRFPVYIPPSSTLTIKIMFERKK